MYFRMIDTLITEKETQELPDLICPSACNTTLDLRSFITKVWCVSDIPSSHGSPAFLIPVQELAPVPPSCPEIVICSALP